MYYGDIHLGETIDIKFYTLDATGAPTTLGGSPAVSAYPGNSTTEITGGITLSVDFDSRTGMHNVRVVATSGNGYAAATNYALVITAGTIGAISAVGRVVGSFSIDNRVTALANAIWDEAIASHVSAGSAGERIERLDLLASGGSGELTGTRAGKLDNLNDTIGSRLATTDFYLRVATAQAGGATSITLDGGASGVNDYYNGLIVTILAGTGSKQSRLITDYDGGTFVATVEPAWATNPDATSVFVLTQYARTTVTEAQINQVVDEVWDELSADHVGAGTVGERVERLDIIASGGAGGLTNARAVNLDNLNDTVGSRLATSDFYLRIATAQAGSSGSITLDGSSSASDDYYNGTWCAILSGTGSKQVRLISDYTGSTKVATVSPDWVTSPDSSSVFGIVPSARVIGIGGSGSGVLTAEDVEDAVWDAGVSDHTDHTTMGGRVGIIDMRSSAACRFIPGG